MEYIADLHLHSKYSRAVSPNMTLPIMAAYAVQKGIIDILTVADWTHPLWFKEVTAQLENACWADMAERKIWKLNSGAD